MFLKLTASKGFGVADEGRGERARTSDQRDIPYNVMPTGKAVGDFARIDMTSVSRC